MIIYYKHYNKLCNRLWAIIPALALALELDQNLIVIGAYKKYVELYPNLKKDKHIKFYINKNKLESSEFLGRLWSILDKFRINKPYTEIQKTKRILFVGSFEKRYEKSYILKHKQKIKDLFLPNSEVISKVENKINNFDNNLYVGIHIRRGDYKYWKNGKYYFSLEFYYKYINIISKFFKKTFPNKKIKIIIASNEKFDIHDPKLLKYLNSELSSHDIIRFNDKEITDLYALSLCDYIVGPPSTFSQWACFIGRGKLLFVDNLNLSSPNLSDFKRVIYLDHFDNEL